MNISSVASVAGVMHVMEHGPHGEISGQAFVNAARLAAWYLREGQRVLGSYQVPKSIADAQELLAWMQRQPGHIIKHADIARNCPGRLRGSQNRRKREEALNLLLETHHIFEVSGIAKLGYKLNLKIRV